MENSNQGEKIRQIFLEFEQFDQFHHKFSLEFENGIYNFVVDHPEQVSLEPEFTEDLKYFAIALINCAYDVIEKNKAYPPYRMEMELENMDKQLERYPMPEENKAFSNGFSQMAKAKMTKYFPALFDLSADGFRLLERSTNYRIHGFLTNLYNKAES